MINNALKIAVLGVSLFAAQVASAATFDFVSMSDNNGDANYIGANEDNWGNLASNGSWGDLAGGVTIGGISLIASGSNAGGAVADAFFDRGNAGLGVCSTPNIGGLSGCSTQNGGSGVKTWDDNVQNNGGAETLTLTFGQTVSITEFLFNDDGHVALTGSLLINGITAGISGGAIVSLSGALAASDTFNLTYTGSQFYLASAEVAAVPLPAGGLLLLTAFGALGATRKRRKKVA